MISVIYGYIRRMMRRLHDFLFRTHKKSYYRLDFDIKSYDNLSVAKYICLVLDRRMKCLVTYTTVQDSKSKFTGVVRCIIDIDQFNIFEFKYWMKKYAPRIVVGDNELDVDFKITCMCNEYNFHKMRMKLKTHMGSYEMVECDFVDNDGV